MLFLKKEIHTWYSISNYSKDFVQISQNFVLVSIIFLHVLFKILHCV